MGLGLQISPEWVLTCQDLVSFMHSSTSTSPFITLPHHWGPLASSSLNDKGSRCPAERDGLPISSPTVVSA